jgi:hypothetical protein
MAVNKYLLQAARQSIKQAFMPPQGGGAPPPGGPPMDPSMMGGAPPPGGPPMDPSMMGGAPPMDPSMMGGAPPPGGGAPPPGGGAPPMDPSMMGGAPPMDPSMMGGAPPMDPSMMGGAPPVDPSAQLRSVIQEELAKALSAAKGGKGTVKKTDGGNAELYMHRIQKLLTHLYSSLGLNLPGDILDDVPKQPDDQAAGKDAPAAPPAKTAGMRHVPTAEKAAGIMYLLRKMKK